MTTKLKFLALSFTLALGAGCGSVPTRHQAQVQVSDVLTEVKRELRLFSRMRKPSAIGKSEAGCSQEISLVPTSVILVLRTTMLRENSSGLTAGELGVLSRADSTRSSKLTGASTLTVPLSIDDIPYGKAEEISPESRSDERSAKRGRSEYGIADTLNALALSLANTDHEPPCLSRMMGKEMTYKMDFDVVQATSNGFELKVIGIALSNKRSSNEGWGHSITVTFEMRGNVYQEMSPDRVMSGLDGPLQDGLSPNTVAGEDPLARQ